ncbi:glyoxylate/hydroxypyruvate reductase HPR3-like [Cornus florida]|uniref:glyoxylate/hydroxypyruvate reductase HPR3-like n=1 Tax=Cornus florida TaxID=4283 RepID=UPI00289812CA|nr:glyoxylate/hydroxypyruvate reductase HPR3-like [Cornus florida]
MAYTQEQEQELTKVVLVLRPPIVFSDYGKHFLEKFHLLKAWESLMPTEQFLATHTSSVQAMLCSGNTPIPAEVLRLLPFLKGIVTTSVGLNQIDLPDCRCRGISVANIKIVYSVDVADIAVGLLIDVLRKITAGDRYVRGRLWPNQGENTLFPSLSIHICTVYVSHI